MKKHNKILIVILGLIITLIAILTGLITSSSINEIYLIAIIISLNIFILIEFIILKVNRRLNFHRPNIWGLFLRIICLAFLLQYSRPGNFTDFVEYYIFWFLFITQFSIFLFIKRLERN